jgi:hypothetical protein
MTQQELNQIAKTLHAAAVSRVGGKKAWGRMAREAKAEAVEVEAWRAVSFRWRPNAPDVWMSDVVQAMPLVYAALNAED